MIESITKARVEEIRNIIRDSAERIRLSSFVIEGPHLLERAFESAPGRIREIFFTESALEENQALFKHAERNNIRSYQITVKQAERLSDTKAPQGIFGLVAMPEDLGKLPVASTESSLVIALDDVQDPGNVGTIIRTAAWFGVRQILLSAECADPY